MYRYMCDCPSIYTFISYSKLCLYACVSQWFSNLSKRCLKINECIHRGYTYTLEDVKVKRNRDDKCEYSVFENNLFLSCYASLIHYRVHCVTIYFH